MSIFQCVCVYVRHAAPDSPGLAGLAGVNIYLIARAHGKQTHTRTRMPVRTYNYRSFIYTLPQHTDDARSSSLVSTKNWRPAHNCLRTSHVRTIASKR